jgi:hypothetical protein
LPDHKAETLDRVLAAAQAFAAQHDDKDRVFLLAAGTAGHRSCDQHRRPRRQPHDAALRVRGGHPAAASSLSAAGAR